ncbi:MAG: hypothetical protein R2707_04900 [Acidimicrobiales bacterium]
MAQSSTARRVARPVRKSAPKPAPRNAELRVVRAEDRARTVGAISSIVASFFFVVLFALAGLHAVVVQTQAELDGVNADIASLEEQRVMRLADLAWADSAVGLETTALAAGLVPAADSAIILTPVAPGELSAPQYVDPFAPVGSSAPLAGSAALAGKPDGTTR